MHITHINLAKGFAGGERQTALLISRIAEHNIEQRLVCRSDAPLLKLLESTPGLTFQFAANLFTGHRFGRMKTDLLHAHEAKAAHWAFLETRFSAKPYIITRRVPNPLKKYGITPTVYKKAAIVVAISSEIRNVLSKYAAGIDIRLIPSAIGELPVREDNVRLLRRRYQKRFVIGHIGTLRDHAKGQINLIEAARILNEKYDDFCFILLGKGEDEKRLRSLASGIDNIEFPGFTEYPGEWLSIMNLFAFPSPREGLGSSILDAMSFGVPVIASDVGGIPDIVSHGKNGLLVPPRNSKALADAIADLYNDPGLRTKFSQEGRRTAAAFSPATMADRYLSLYREILQSCSLARMD